MHLSTRKKIKKGKISNILFSIMNLYINITILINIINHHRIIYIWRYILISALARENNIVYKHIIPTQDSRYC